MLLKLLKGFKQKKLNGIDKQYLVIILHISNCSISTLIYSKSHWLTVHKTNASLLTKTRFWSIIYQEETLVFIGLFVRM